MNFNIPPVPTPEKSPRKTELGVPNAEQQERETPLSPEEQLQLDLVRIDEGDPEKWQRLYSVLEKEAKNGLEGSRKKYSFDELVQGIAAAKEDPEKLQYLTSTAELRDTVERLASRTPEQGFARGESTQEALAGFSLFTTKHEQELEKLAHSQRDLEGYIYDNFYSEASPEVSHEPYDASRAAQYEKEAKVVLDEFLSFSEKYKSEQPPRIEPSRMIHNGWVYFKTHGGASRTEPMGRLYLHIDTRELPQMYRQAMIALSQHGVSAEAKIEQTMDETNFTRPDSMVVYFNEADEKPVLDIIEALHKERPASFREGRPQGTSEILRNDQPLTGVAFGEEPKQTGEQKSFGQVRSRIFAEMYLAAKNEGVGMASARAFALYHQICAQYGVDAFHSAFNAATNQQRQGNFQYIRSRAS